MNINYSNCPFPSLPCLEINFIWDDEGLGEFTEGGLENSNVFTIGILHGKLAIPAILLISSLVFGSGLIHVSELQLPNRSAPDVSLQAMQLYPAPWNLSLKSIQQRHLINITFRYCWVHIMWNLCITLYMWLLLINLK